MATTYSHLRRLFTITRVLARCDALELVERLPGTKVAVFVCRLLFRRRADGPVGQRLARSCVELGPTFIKVGQALSTRPDLVGEETAKELTQLQDKLPPFPFTQAKAIIEGDFGGPLESLYESFDETPVAAASIAQVHYAVAVGGAPVAVKILRPDAHAQLCRDVALFMWIARLVERLRPNLRRFQPVESVKVFEETVALEMDLRYEAAAAAELADNFKHDDTFRVPAIDWQRTGRQVMTQERLCGVPLDERDNIIAMGLDPIAVIGDAARAFFNMAFRDGFFHADLHPGNLFVDQKGTILCVDFGIMGRISESNRHTLGEMLLGFLTKDYYRVAKAQVDANWITDNVRVDVLAQAVRAASEPVFGKTIEEISMAWVLNQILKMTRQFDIEIQPQLLLLEKSMFLAEGVGRSLAPNVNMWELAYPLAQKWMRRTSSPRARFKSAALIAAKVLRRLPTTLKHAEKAVALLADDVSPPPVGIRRQKKSPAWQLWLPWAIVACLLAVLALR